MADVLEYKCPACGGKLEFESSTQKMKCPYCDSEIDVEALKSFDEKLNAASQREEEKIDFETGEVWEDDSMNVYTCEACGGEIIADGTTAATHCPYCDNPVILTKKLSGALKPDYVIPFKLSKDDAKQGLLKHLQGKPFLPGIFKKQNHIDEIKAIYVPFWLYDSTIDADFTFKATRTRHWSDKNYDYTETSFYEVFRSGIVNFERIPADGSKKMPDDLMESIEPFDFTQAVDFQTAYLSGYLADKYDVTAEENVPRIQERMTESADSYLKSTVNGYMTVQTEDKICKFSDSKVKYALFPVFILNTSWNGKKYLFAMNGQTGKFVGDLPVSKGKFAAALAGLTVGFSALTTAIAFILGLLG